MTDTRRGVLRKAGTAAGATAVGSTAGCLSVFGGGSTSIAAASMQWTEAKLLGYMGYESLKANTDLTIENELGLGGSMQCFNAVKSGQVDFYHLYTGGAYATIPPKHDEIPKDPEVLYQRAKEEMREQHDLRYLQRANYNNTYALALRPEFAEKTGLENISDYAEYLNGGNTDHTVALGPEFAERADGWPGLAETYGFAEAAEEVNIKKIGANLTYQILGEGEAEVGMVFTTNAKIKKYNLSILEDDQNFFPPYNPAPLVNGNTVESTPAIKKPLNAPMRALDSEQQIIDLNAQIALEGKDVQTVAQNFLESEGII